MIHKSQRKFTTLKRKSWSLAFLIAVGGGLEAQVSDYATVVNGCGAPGQVECSTLPSCGNAKGNAFRIDPFTGQDRCDLPTPVCTAFNLPLPVPLDVTFLVATDIHFGRSDISVSDHVRHVANMNSIPNLGWDWSQANAGFPKHAINSVYAVITTGDDTHDGQSYEEGPFRMLYETGTVSDALNYPLYAGLGNHDVGNDCEFDNCALRMFDYVARAAPCGGNVSVDPLSHNYSWDWGPIHMVQLNLWAGDTSLGTNDSVIGKPKETHPSGLPWLALDLAAHVGNSGRPVVFFQHFGWDPFSLGTCSTCSTIWWSSSDTAAFLNIIKDYNVAGVFSGHQHITGMYSATVTDDSGNTKIIDDFTGGQGGIGGPNGSGGGFGEFFTVRLTDTFMDVLPVEWDDTKAGGLPYMTALGTAPDYNGVNAYSYNNVNGCRKWIGKPLEAVPVSTSTSGNTITFTNNTGTVLKGPFAVGVTLNHGGQGGSLNANAVMFSTSCAQGPLYQISSKQQLVPGESDSVTFNGSWASIVNVVTLAPGNALIAGPPKISLGASQPVTVNVSALTGTLGFTYNVDRSWIKVSSNSNQTPATLTLTVDTTATGTLDKGTLSIVPNDSTIGPVRIEIDPAPVTVTVTASGLESLKVDDKTVTTPATFSWYPNDKHNLSASDINLSNGGVDRFTDWSDHGAARHDLLAPFLATTYQAHFMLFYPVSASASPSAGGTVTISPSSPDGMYANQTSLKVIETPNSGYVFSSFQGLPKDINVSGTHADFHVIGPLNIQALFVQPGSYVITTSLGAGGSETVDGKTSNGPATATWDPGTSHNISVPTEIDPSTGVRDLFTQWSDSATAPAARTVTAGTTTTYTANYKTQYLLTTAVSPAGGGTITGAGWYDAGTAATVQATPAAGFTFSSFSSASGDLTSSQNPASLTMNQAENVVANFTPGTPALFASAGPRVNSDSNTTLMVIVLNNTGVGAAANAEIDSITANVVLGTGTVTPPPVSHTTPIALGTILPNQSASTASLSLAWPSTARRVAFTVNFSANGGTASGQSTFYVLR